MCMKIVTVDYGRCEGCGGCAEAFPALFEMRDDKAWVAGGGVLDPVQQQGLLTICPYYAIAIEDA